ncbi:KR-domain-containing protein [Nemania sp. FL0031]|nr:KR-domain-containing protein [Nemania sp. FL0031]
MQLAWPHMKRWIPKMLISPRLDNMRLISASGLGQAAVQSAKHIGAETFATACSETKRQLLVDVYNLPPDQIFSSQGLSFAKGIMRMTNGKGVDVVLNSLLGEVLMKTCNIGLDMSPFQRNETFASVNMEHILRHNRVLIARGSVGLIKPIAVYNYSEMGKAFEMIEKAEHVDKIVLRAQPEDLVPAIPRNPNSVHLDGNATYVLVGGLGGIGRSLALFLAEHGAKNIAFISRSGSAKPEAQATMDELKDLGIHANSYKCDVADPEAFGATMAHMSVDMPPVKGSIHTAMVLNDILFEAMTYKRWFETTRVKIQGAWNMHAMMPKDLDFFIMLSSASGYMGGSTLGNYASGNTYLDGLAQYRRSKGLAACALGLGFIADIGWEVENVKVSEEYRADWDIVFIRSPVAFSMCLGTGGELQHTKLIKTRYYYTDPKYAYLRLLDVRELGTQDSSKNAAVKLKSALSSATSLAQAADIIADALAAKLALSMSMAPEDIDTSKPVSAYGVDSLISLEIKTWVFTVIKCNLGSLDLLRTGPMMQLAAKIAEGSMLIPEEVRKKGIE